MSFKLRILFDGLCVLIPHVYEDVNAETPFVPTSSTSTAAMCVLLVDARAPGKASEGEDHFSHIPCIRFNTNDLKYGSTSPADYTFFKANSPEEQRQDGMWVLTGDELEIKGLSTSSLKIVRGGGSRDYGEIEKVLHELYPETNGLQVKDKCITDNIEKLKNLVVARFTLTGGEIGMVSDSMEAGNAEIYFEATVDDVEIFSPQQDKRLILQPSNGQGTLLKPKEPNVVEKGIEIRIENLPIRELIPKEGTAEFDHFQLFDFELGYRVFNLPKTNAEVDAPRQALKDVIRRPKRRAANSNQPFAVSDANTSICGSQVSKPANVTT
ncbi:MAG: hypothetical protein AB1489_22100 [Acidobacteriota bacterium]